MNQTMKQAKEHIKRQKKAYLFLIILIGLGLISGIVFIFFLSKEDSAMVKEQLRLFFEQMKNLDNLNYQKGFLNSITSNFLFAGSIFFLGISIIGLPIVLFLLFMKGFITGFSISSIIANYQWKGILGTGAYIFPHQIINLVIWLLLTFYAASFSIKLFSCLFLKKNINLREAMKKFLKIFLICIIGLAISSIIEIFVSPFLLQLFAQTVG